MSIMQNMLNMTEKKAFEDDVKGMSYDELMNAMRYLDHERQVIANKVHYEIERIEKRKDIKK